MSKKNKDSIGGIRRADYLPRTLIGVNGVRLINIPGVYYTPHMLTEKTQRERHLPVILSKPPAWAISSRQAEEILAASNHQPVSCCTASECAFAVWPRKGARPWPIGIGGGCRRWHANSAHHSPMYRHS